MRYLLDTCVVSEFAKPKANRVVLDWVEQRGVEQLYLSVITLGEIQKGAARLGPSTRASRIEEWLHTEVRQLFEGRILPVNEKVALRWGEIQGKAQAEGRVLPVVDSLIAATALVHELTVVTRNTPDMANTGVDVFDPWTR